MIDNRLKKENVSYRRKESWGKENRRKENWGKNGKERIFQRQERPYGGEGEREKREWKKGAQAERV